MCFYVPRYTGVRDLDVLKSGFVSCTLTDSITLFFAHCLESSACGGRVSNKWPLVAFV